MIKIEMQEELIVIDLEENYNSKVKHQIELLAIKYHATQLFRVNDDYDITNTIFQFKNKDEMFLYTLIGNVLNCGTVVDYQDQRKLILKNVN